MGVELSRRYVDGAWRYVAQEEVGGGGDPAALPRAEYLCDDLISDGNELVAWVAGPDTGFAPLDLTDPTQPVVTDGGLYNFAVSTSLRSPIGGDPAWPTDTEWPGLFARVVIEPDYNGFGWVAASTFDLNVRTPPDASNPNAADAVSVQAIPSGIATITCYVPDGGVVAALITHNWSDALRFSSCIAVHKLA